ncbi:MAG: TetR/AcrR family transcriptional regulator [Fidelibacterota bacterium]
MMTEKKQYILAAALDLFSRQGINKTTTAEIAQTAGVSEGLVFRHFQHKQGLVDTLWEQCQNHVAQHCQPLLQSSLPPRNALQQIMSLPFDLKTADFPFWKVLYRLTWHYPADRPSPLELLRIRLENIFSVLGHTDAAAEAQTVLMILDGVVLSRLYRTLPGRETLRRCLLEKYDLDEW